MEGIELHSVKADPTKDQYFVFFFFTVFLATFSLLKSFYKHCFWFVSCSNGNGSKMNGSLEHLDQPDPDTIKMFVGQIPRSWSETELKELFEPFGAVHQINILRDRTQNPPQSKGKVRASHYFSYGLAHRAT